MKSQFREKNPVLPINKFYSIIYEVIAEGRFKTKENFQLLASKVVKVA